MVCRWSCDNIRKLGKLGLADKKIKLDFGPFLWIIQYMKDRSNGGIE
jgi:hypothetical protein